MLFKDNHIFIKKLEGKIITQVSFSLNTILLFFSEGYIQISGGYSVQAKGKSHIIDEVYPVKSDNGLLNLLELSIKRIEIDDDNKCLKLFFDNKVELNLLSDDHYESLLIKIDQEEIRF